MADNSALGTSRQLEHNQSVDSIEEGKSEARQDAFVVFSNEKDLRHHEAIRIKASLYTGIALRLKIISPGAMENLLHAIDIDSGVVPKKEDVKKEEGKAKTGESSNKKPTGVENAVAKFEPFQTAHQKPGIVNLRFEECKFTRKAAILLTDWLKSKAVIETFAFVKVSFEEIFDFKKVAEGIKLNSKLLKISFQNMNLDNEIYGTAIGRIIQESRTIRELDCSHVVFDYRPFYDMSQVILSERCRLNVLKFRGLLIGEIEGKIIQFILMKNKTIHTLDLSECVSEDSSHYEYFFEKLDQFCNIRYLTLEKMQPDLSNNLETIGEALADNKRLEVLILKDNKLKWVNYQNFFTNLLPNRSIQKLVLQKTELCDRVIDKLAKYIEQEGILLADLDLSKNQVTDLGLKSLSQSLMRNTSVMYLNLSGNKIKDEGLTDFVELMKVNVKLLEISFGGNTISNEGITILAGMLPHNKTLRHLDLSRNSFSDAGFEVFADALAFNEGILYLDIAKNKEITDEGSLISLCDALTFNKKLQTLDLTGLVVRKPFLKQNFDQALKRNITLQDVIGKIPSNIISAELEQNILIEKELLPLFQTAYRPGKDAFQLSLVESNIEHHTRLILKDQPSRLHKAAFKLIRNFDIRSVDFTSAGLHDDSMRMLALYLRTDPNLRSIVLDKNMFSDEGLQKLTKELEKNTKLAHLSIKGCTNLSNAGLQKLCDVISTTNTCLFQVDLDVDQFDKELALTVITESALNRDIQEKLKPVKTITVLNQKGDVVSHGMERRTKIENINDEESSSEEEEQLRQMSQTNSGDNLNQGVGAEISSTQEVTEATEQSVILKTTAIKKLAQKKPASTEQLNNEDAGYRTVIEVKFDDKAHVSECFASAIKAWRINGPNVINLENQNLTDDHIDKLCHFLADRDMITHLNLRRNHISNQGAKMLSNFVQEFDHTLTHLDVTRNHIGQDGGQAILDALNATTRIVDCQIKYGNPISNKMGRIIEREIKANIQAVSYAMKHSQQGAVQKYELVDKGPEFMRCAIKMAQLHNILILSLPDNMLALEDARMLADLIKRNTPLKKLNLKTNQLDADCAALLANALIYNDHLQVLDVSGNQLGDLGAYFLLTPLIRKNLQDKAIVGKITPIIREKVLAQGKDVKGSRRLFKQIAIKTQLQYVGLEQNMTTKEVYKQVWLLLVANETIVIKLEDLSKSIAHLAPDEAIVAKKPSQSQQSDQGHFFSFGNSGNPKPAASHQFAAKKVVPEPSVDDSKSQLLDQIQPRGRSEVPVSNLSLAGLGGDFDSDEENLDEEELKALERIANEREKERKAILKREKAFQRRKKTILCCQKVSCFKDEEGQYNLSDKLPSITQVCCWRFLRARRQSTKFHASKEVLEKMEKSGFTKCASLLISVNYLALYAVVIVPFILISTKAKIERIVIGGVEFSCDDKPTECSAETEQNRVDFNNFVLMINAIVLIYSMMCETVIVCKNLKPSNTRCNTYLACQVLTGFTMRAVILISAQLIAVFIQDIKLVNYILGCVLACTLVISQLRALQIWLLAMKVDPNCLLPRIRQNYRISMSTNYLAAATLYSKVSVEATERAIEQTKVLQAERERMMSFSGFADEDQKGNRRAQVRDKLAKKCKCCRWASPKFYQLLMNDIPLMFCLPFAYIFGLLDNVNAAIGLLLTLLDLVFMLFYLSYDEELSIDANQVFSLTEKRLTANEATKKKLENDHVSADDILVEGLPNPKASGGALSKRDEAVVTDSDAGGDAMADQEQVGFKTLVGPDEENAHKKFQLNDDVSGHGEGTGRKQAEGRVSAAGFSLSDRASPLSNSAI